ncbi:hypothetical protein GCM10010304_76700 [Streptomyces roseoviolaceus]
MLGARLRLERLPVTQSGTLPPRDDRLEALPRWADAFLAQAPVPHRKHLTPFPHWYLLHRIRRALRHRPLRASTRHHIMTALSWPRTRDSQPTGRVAGDGHT